MWIAVVSIVASIVTSAIVTIVLAAHYFKMVDSYVDEMCGLTKEFTKAIEKDIHRTLQSSDLKG